MKYTEFLKNRIWCENTFSFSALVSMLGENMCQCPPKERTDSPLFNPSLWRLWRGGADNAKRLCQARSHRASSLDATCSQGVSSGFSNCLTRAHNTKRGNGQDLFFGLRCVGVLDAEDDVGAGAATGGLLQKVAALQWRCQTSHSAVACPPCFTVVVWLSVALVAWSMPDHFLWPGDQNKHACQNMEAQKEASTTWTVTRYMSQDAVPNKDSPGAVPENVSTIEGVDWHILSYFACIITKDRLPGSEQHLVLQENMMHSI